MTLADHGDLATRTSRVLEGARSLGFGLVGVTDAQPGSHSEHYRAWLDAGSHGEMDYLARNVEVRLDPCELVGGAASIIAVADAYADDPPPAPERHGRVAKYAHGDDYHKVIKKRLHVLCDKLAAHWPSEAFRAVVDTAPALEREHATRAGLGWTGKHTLLIHPRHGSFMLLGLIVTTLRLQPTREPGLVADHCGSCTRCIDACPTQCITPYSVDARRCISYLTLEHRSGIDPSMFTAIGDWITGCDVCQDVCPWNSSTNRVPLPVRDEYAPRNVSFDLLAVLSWTEEDRRAAFARSALKRVKLDMLRRNALIAAGNRLATRHDPPLLERVRAIAVDADEPTLVRETARAVLDQLPT